MAEQEGIPIQYDWMAAGGTDGGRMQLLGAGVPAIAIGVPARYIHSAASMISRSDFERRPGWWPRWCAASTATRWQGCAANRAQERTQQEGPPCGRPFLLLALAPIAAG